MLGRKYTTIKDIPWKDGTRIPTGVQVTVTFITSEPSLAEIWSEDTCHRIYISRLFTLLKDFPKPPSVASMGKMSFNGIAKSVYGKKVEPGGWDPEGSPSWLLVEGVI